MRPTRIARKAAFDQAGSKSPRRMIRHAMVGAVKLSVLGALAVAGLAAVAPTAPLGRHATIPRSKSTQTLRDAVPASQIVTGPSTTWFDVAGLPSSIEILYGVTCPSETVCLAVGETTSGYGVVYETTNGGVTWTEPSVPSWVGDLQGISCSSTSSCVAVGNAGSASGVIFYQSTVGGSFTSETLPSGVGGLVDVSCGVGTDLCTAVGYDGSTAEAVIMSTDSGADWSGPESSVSVSGDLWWSWSGVQCFSDAETCVVAGVSYNGPVFASTTDAWGGVQSSV